MLINSICLCRVFILFPLSRIPAYNLGLTFGTRLRTGRKRQKRKIASEPSRAVVWEREREKKLTPPRRPPPPHPLTTTSEVLSTASLANFFRCSSQSRTQSLLACWSAGRRKDPVRGARVAR